MAVWVAAVRRAGVKYKLPGSRSTDPRECARCVIAWYRCEFGESWPAVLAARKVNPFAVRHSARHGGYVVAVWVLGRREEVTVLRRARGTRDRWEPTGALAVFATEAEARRGYRLYLVRRFGLLAEFVAFRERAPADRGMAV